MIFIPDLLNLKIDYVFKRVFGHVGSEEFTKDLLQSIIGTKISNIDLDCKTILEKDILDDKIGILDIKAKLNGITNCDIEMQVTNQNNIENRLVFYASKQLVQSTKSGEEYAKLQKSIAVLFADFDLDSLKSLPKYVTKWNLREEEYSKIILTPIIEIYIIELKKFEKHYKKFPNKKINNWLKFINNPEVMVDMKDKNIVNAKKVLEKISADEHERYLAELRDKYIRDQKSIEHYGYDRGLEKGLEQGKKESTYEIAKNLLSKNIPLEIISETTGLSKKELKKIKI